MKICLFFILKGQHALLRGTLIPLGLLSLVLVGYGSFILYSRPQHAKQSMEIFENNWQEGVEKEKEKHINDNKAGKALMSYVYPGLILLGALGMFFFKSPSIQGVFLGIIVLAASIFVLDYGFVSRSDAFIEYLNDSK